MSGAEEPTWRALSTAVRDAPVGIGVCDEDGRLIAVSRSLERLLGRPAAEIVGRPFLVFVHPEDRPASLAAYFEAVVAAAAGVHSGATRLRCLAGERDTITVEVGWTVTEEDQTSGPCGILYLTPTTGGPAAGAARPAARCAGPRPAALTQRQWTHDR